MDNARWGVHYQELMDDGEARTEPERQWVGVYVRGRETESISKSQREEERPVRNHRVWEWTVRNSMEVVDTYELQMELTHKHTRTHRSSRPYLSHSLVLFSWTFNCFCFYEGAFERTLHREWDREKMTEWEWRERVCVREKQTLEVFLSILLKQSTDQYTN